MKVFFITDFELKFAYREKTTEKDKSNLKTMLKLEIFSQYYNIRTRQAWTCNIFEFGSSVHNFMLSSARPMMHVGVTIWVKLFKNGPSKICGRQPLKNFTWYILEYLDPYDHDQIFEALVNSSLDIFTC